MVLAIMGDFPYIGFIATTAMGLGLWAFSLSMVYRVVAGRALKRVDYTIFASLLIMALCVSTGTEPECFVGEANPCMSPWK